MIDIIPDYIAVKLSHKTLLTWLTILSWLNGLRSLFYPDKVLLKAPYKGEKILLIALYEKGELRKDIKNLLSIAKAKGFYVIGVNTQKILDYKKTADLFDTYIWRYNFGRDFGSYKTGFKNLFKNNMHKDCPRLIFLNDSVYYEPVRTAKFIDDLENTNIEVLGATENYEIEQHLGSFCISISGRILRHKKFFRYWNNYRNSDVRPTVIRRGEMKLSKCLKRIAMNTENFSALYSMSFLAKKMDDQDTLNDILKFLRRTSIRAWVTISPPKVWQEFIRQYYTTNLDFGQPIKIKTKFDDMFSYHSVHDLYSMKDFFEEKLKIKDENLLNNMSRFFSAIILAAFRRGSHIHQNNAILLFLGMPIIKLDGFFRGPFMEEDILLLGSLMSEENRDELYPILFNKSYGDEVLFGWKRWLFQHGFV